MPHYSPLHQQALRFIAEHRDLCDLLVRRSMELAACLEKAEELREVVTRLVLQLRRAVRQFATREVCDEKRLLQSVSGLLRWRAGLKGYAGQILRRCSKRAWALEQIYGEGERFEADSVDEHLLQVLRLYKTQQDGAMRLRDWMRAIAHHYANITGRQETYRFLQELADEFGIF